MELKHGTLRVDGTPLVLLIVPCGIETLNSKTTKQMIIKLLIVPCGIETGKSVTACFVAPCLLIVPCGIETLPGRRTELLRAAF